MSSNVRFAVQTRYADEENFATIRETLTVEESKAIAANGAERNSAQPEATRPAYRVVKLETVETVVEG